MGTIIGHIIIIYSLILSMRDIMILIYILDSMLSPFDKSYEINENIFLLAINIDRTEMVIQFSYSIFY